MKVCSVVVFVYGPESVELFDSFRTVETEHAFARLPLRIVAPQASGMNGERCKKGGSVRTVIDDRCGLGDWTIKGITLASVQRAMVVDKTTLLS